MFTRVHHVAIVVRSLEEALRVYRDILGLPVGERATVADQGVQAALLPMGDGEIELLEAIDPAGGVARFLERRGESFHHLCLETPDVAAAIARAKAADLPLIDQSPRRGLAGMIAFLHPKANHGVLVEMAQPLEPPPRPEPPSGGIQATGICTVYLAVRELAEAAATYARDFQGTMGQPEGEPHFGARRLPVRIGSSLVTLLGSAEPRSPLACFLADRGEGVFGVCLRVTDFWRAVRFLRGAGIPTEVQGRDPTTSLARLDPSRVNGVNLFLCP